jgi:hypothetical protein
MNKPNSVTIKEWLIRKMSIDLVTSEKIINSVVSHQFESATNALNLHKSVEISGFGKFYFNEKKAKQQLDKWNKIKEAYEKILENENTPIEKRNNIQVRLANLLVSIKKLKQKIYGCDGNL